MHVFVAVQCLVAQAETPPGEQVPDSLFDYLGTMVEIKASASAQPGDRPETVWVDPLEMAAPLFDDEPSGWEQRKQGKQAEQGGQEND